MSRQSISLCLVVKNEELFLRECLNSVKGCVDEMIVVDTGSGDRTVDIARAAGAKVFEEPWPGDLAIAHDLPLRHATCDWLFTLDGDEALDRQGANDVRQLVQVTDCDGYVFTVRNYQFQPKLQHRPVNSAEPNVHGARSWSPSANIRLFRNRSEFLHQGRVHQSVLPAMKRCSAKIGTTTIPIHHYGFLRTDRQKSPFYVALAEQQVRDDPDNAKAHLELGILYFSANRFDDALVSFRLSKSLGGFAESDFFIGQTFASEGKNSEAEQAFMEAIASDVPLRFFVDKADIFESLGHTQLELGNESAAEEAFRSALQIKQDSPVAESGHVSILASRGAFFEAASVANSLTDRYPGLALSWETMGYVSLMAGIPDAAVSNFKRALDINPEHWTGQYNLVLAHARCGDEERARIALQQALETDDERLPHEFRNAQCARPKAAEVCKLGPRGVLSFIPHFSGGAAFVATELARVLAPAHPQIVATLDHGEFTGEAHRNELNALGVPLIVVRSAEELTALQRSSMPGAVIHHWWQNNIIPKLSRTGDECLIMRSASPSPMPAGYDQYVTLSAFQEQYQKHLPLERLTRIPNGVDCRRFVTAVPRDDLWENFEQANAVRIAMVSRLDPDKFVRRLADFLAPLDGLPVIVAIAGRGGRRWEIEPELKARSMAKWIRFLGPIPQTMIPGFLAAADMGLHLTETHQESHSLTILQMMAAGLPIVAQPRGCLSEMVLAEKTGFLAFEEEEVAGALRRLILDSTLRSEFSAAARDAVQAFSTDVFARRWRTLIDRLLPRAA